LYIGSLTTVLSSVGIDHAGRMSKWVKQAPSRQIVVNEPKYDGISYCILILTRSTTKRIKSVNQFVTFSACNHSVYCRWTRTAI